MNLNFASLMFLLSLILCTQVVAIFVQYKINRNYKGVGYWLLGSSLIALGFILMPTAAMKSLMYVARIANPLVILGHILICIGVKQFLNKSVDKRKSILGFVLFNIIYYYYMYIDNNISARTMVISIVIAIISFIITYEILFNKDKLLSGTARFTAYAFFLYGCSYVIRIFFTITTPQVPAYIDLAPSAIAATIFPIIVSNLWTFGLIIMINQRLNIENKFKKEKLQLIFNTNIDAQLITRLDDGLIVEVNDEFPILSGYDKEELVGSNIKSSIFWNNPEDRKAFITILKEKGVCKNIEFEFLRKDNKKFTATISARIIKIHSIAHSISVIRDITQRKKIEDALKESEEKYRSILNASPDDITITDLNGSILMVSPAAKEIFGYESDFDDFVGMHILEFILPEEAEKAKSQIVQMHQGVNRSTNEYRGVRQDRSIFDIEVSSGLIYNANGIADKMVFIVRDITKRKSSEYQMKELVEQLEKERNIAEVNSITDSLTGLFNRRHFDNTLRTEFSRLTIAGSTLSLIMLDIDYFKKFNDSYGHLAGDNCIQMITSTLKAIVDGESYIAARYGGEEFIVILPEVDKNGAEIFGERIRKSVEELQLPHESSDISKYVTVSVGIATVYPSVLVSPDQVLKQVDDALYCAKKSGRNCCRYEV